MQQLHNYSRACIWQHQVAAAMLNPWAQVRQACWPLLRPAPMRRGCITSFKLSPNLRKDLTSSAKAAQAAAANTADAAAAGAPAGEGAASEAAAATSAAAEQVRRPGIHTASFKMTSCVATPVLRCIQGIGAVGSGSQACAR